MMALTSPTEMQTYHVTRLTDGDTSEVPGAAEAVQSSMDTSDFADEINVYNIPHTRMKRLAQMAVDKLNNTNCSNASELLTTVKTLSRVFYEFKTHERIENECIMRRLQAKLNTLNIQNTAVCNCHKDDELTVMLKLFSDGIRYSTKSESERIKYGMKLREELERFQEHFLPHMREEEEIFQPLLVQYFSFTELKNLKESVLKQHQLWNTVDNLDDIVQQYEDGSWPISTGTHSSSDIKSWSGTSSSSFHLSCLFDEKQSNAEIESLYLDSLDGSIKPGCGYLRSSSLFDDKMLIESFAGKSNHASNLSKGNSPYDSLLHLPSTSRLHSPTKTTASETKIQNLSLVHLVPSEILARIFTFLTIRDLCRVAQVCRRWNAIALDAQLWCTVAPLVWIQSTEDEKRKDESWPNITNIETDSQASILTDVHGDRLVPVDGEDADGFSLDGSNPLSASGASQKSDVPSDFDHSAFRREHDAVTAVAYQLVPKIGPRVTRLVLAGSRALTNVLLRRILHYIPNVVHLNVRDTRIGDAAFKSLNRHHISAEDDDDNGVCLGRLRQVNLSGCVNFTDVGLQRLIQTMDGALERLATESHNKPRSSASDSRLKECESMMSGISGRSDISEVDAAWSRGGDTSFQGLVMSDDQMMMMRRKAEQKRRPSQHASGASLSSADSHLLCHRNAARKETLCDVETDVKLTQSENMSELESSGTSTKKSFNLCDACPRSGTTACPMVEGSQASRDFDAETEESRPSVDRGLAEVDYPGDADSTVERLPRPLEYISLSGCYQITDEGLWCLCREVDSVTSGLPNLKHLDLSGCMNVTVEGLIPVLDACPLINLKHLFYCDNVSLGVDIDDLASGCRNLQRGSRACCRTGL